MRANKAVCAKAVCDIRHVGTPQENDLLTFYRVWYFIFLLYYRAALSTVT